MLVMKKNLLLLTLLFSFGVQGILLADDEALPAYDSSLQEEKIIIETNSPTENSPTYTPKETVYPLADNLYAQETSGNYINLYQFKGKPVLLVFWAPYDRYSVKSLRILQEFEKKYGKKGLQVIAVAIDTPEDVRQFVEANKNFTFIIAVGQKYLARDYGIWGLPTFYVLDKDLGVRKILSGYVNKKTLEKEVKSTL